MCSILKKGDMLETKNYRGISLLDNYCKILSLILLERLAPLLRRSLEDISAVSGKQYQQQIKFSFSNN